MKWMSGIRKPSFRGVVIIGGAGLLLVAAVSPAAGQPSPGGDCLCLGVCPAPGSPVPITNLDDKSADLVLCASDADPLWCKTKWNKHNPVEVATVQAAITAINTAYNANNPPVPLNVIVHGHGGPGVQCFGPDPECIGNNVAEYLANKVYFVKGDENKEGVRNKIKDLILLGCSVADADKGQGFLEKLKGELVANSVKGFTGDNFFGDPWTNTQVACDLQNPCPQGQVCFQAECWQVQGGYETEGLKKTLVPTVSEWGLVVMALLTLTAATVVIMRRRAVVG